LTADTVADIIDPDLASIAKKRSDRSFLKAAGVAQLVEQRFRKPQVARSIRVAGSKPSLLDQERM
jgi:hypothetical protein